MGVLYSQQLQDQLSDVHKPVRGTQEMGASAGRVLGSELAQHLDGGPLIHRDTADGTKTGIFICSARSHTPEELVPYPSSVLWLHPLMALRTGSERDTCRGTEGAHTSRHTEARRVPRTNSTFAQVLPSPDSLPSTKMAEQLLATWGQRGDGRWSGGLKDWD